MQAFTDMKFKGDLSEKSKEGKKKILHIKRTSLSPPSNLFFSVPKEQLTPSDMHKMVIRMFPKNSPKLQTEPKDKTY
jgi:hypothetical protein